MKTKIAQREDGQILNCKFGHRWPLSLYTSGYVKVFISTTAKGKVKLTHKWAATKEELQ